MSEVLILRRTVEGRNRWFADLESLCDELDTHPDIDPRQHVRDLLVFSARMHAAKGAEHG